ncbi:MAG: DUF4388 domain-containing protein [Planctomycetota bacterium]|nr:DUF4388 domain-containing protein [Planctomycetota bacterium]
MNARPISLVVSKADGCSLLKEGDRWVVAAHEVAVVGESKVCAQALCSFYPHLKNLLQITPKDMALPPMLLRCQGEGCSTIFRIEAGLPKQPAHPPAAAKPAAPPPPPAGPAPVTIATPVPGVEPAAITQSNMGVTRRLERGALAAGSKLQEQGTFLSRIPPHAAVKVVGAARKVVYQNGQLILDEGVRGDSLYIVGDGKVEVHKRSAKDGTETILAVLNTGECFGEMSLLTGEPTSAAVRARGEASIFVLGRKELDELLIQIPELNRIFSQLLAARLRTVNMTLESELGRGILGKLSMISMIDLVQTLNASRRTGTLVLTGSAGEAHVIFKNGAVVGASMGQQKGEEAFYAVVAWPEGDFCFEQDQTEVPPASAIQKETMGLLMESMRRLDEAKR